MPIDASIQMDPNKPRFGLPVDSCVGDDGPTPEEVTKNPGGPTGDPVSGYKAVDVPVGYDGPEGS